MQKQKACSAMMVSYRTMAAAEAPIRLSIDLDSSDHTVKTGNYRLMFAACFRYSTQSLIDQGKRLAQTQWMFSEANIDGLDCRS